MSFSSFRDLRVWQGAMKLTAEVYRGTVHCPRHELYGLTSQMRRAAVSVPSNIAEGKGHHSDKEFSHFLFHAGGSLLIAGNYNTCLGKMGNGCQPCVKALVAP
jgi:23S rRNA-intervening sequence protein